MRVIVAAVGRLKDAERELCERYVEALRRGRARPEAWPVADLRNP